MPNVPSTLPLRIQAADFNDMDRMTRWKTTRKFLQEISKIEREQLEVLATTSAQIDEVRENANKLAEALSELEQVTKREGLREESGTLNVTDTDDIVVDGKPMTAPQPKPKFCTCSEKELANALTNIKGLAKSSSMKAAADIFERADNETIQELYEALGKISSKQSSLFERTEESGEDDD